MKKDKEGVEVQHETPHKNVKSKGQKPKTEMKILYTNARGIYNRKNEKLALRNKTTRTGYGSNNRNTDKNISVQGYIWLERPRKGKGGE